MIRIKFIRRVWRVLCAVVLMIQFVNICSLHTYAAIDNVEIHNMLQNSLWVNWYPSDLCIDEDIKKLAGQLNSTYTWDELPKAIHDWVCDNIYYDADAFERETYSALQAGEVLRDKKTVCEGIANLVQELFISLEIPCIKTWGVATLDSTPWCDSGLDMSRINHTWNEYYVDGCWYSLDCTMDMNNRYEKGTFISNEKSDTFFAKKNDVFSQTHKILQRGNDTPYNIPSEWAIPELTIAVNSRCIALPFFSHYHEPVTNEDFCEMLGIQTGNVGLITRAEAARMLSDIIPNKSIGMICFDDLDECDLETKQSIQALYELGIVRGTGERSFSPNAYLTREEAIVLISRYYRSER